ncbi:DNA cytosine methyltransferase [Thiocapsa rosea]|uniref:DNA (cytosine-5-)-methyltransferase n=1 Tax=Thiocapsa rosea TaxID=69360 RepID=A0A495VCA8_9GAMM|nr:DNA cytosine methyltransferase [Thiocapsa rosea]RKT47041.1 DNA (cytosine-5)-methyltransferase 1 [Thiocapsa rosea]
MKIAGLFSGIGGLELPFHARGAEAALLCDIWDASRCVLEEHFPGVPLVDDIRNLDTLPAGVQVVTAGFPCTDLSQAGRTAGISGDASGLVSHVFRLLHGRDIEWLVLENVRNMLVLDRGRAMAYLVSELEALGFQWAYRLVDSRFSGVPQRRHRVLFAASRHHDPREVLFADEAGEPPAQTFREDAFGFYWTEGLSGLGWAQDAVPPLKGGSTIGIPSPPGVWIPGAAVGHKLVTPDINDAEALQGFDRGWTEPAMSGKKKGPRWKLVGNAVTVGVAEWLIDRLYQPGSVVIPGRELTDLERWPNAAFGRAGRRWLFDASAWPVRRTYQHLLDVLNPDALAPLSHRAAAGFLARTKRSTLTFHPDFLVDLEAHVAVKRAEADRAFGQRGSQAAA